MGYRVKGSGKGLSIPLLPIPYAGGGAGGAGLDEA
jgi:hypothetical protein